jgi:hypothetical protein
MESWFEFWQMKGDFPLLRNVHTSSATHSPTIQLSTVALFTEIKQPRREADGTTPSTAEELQLSPFLMFL